MITKQEFNDDALRARGIDPQSANADHIKQTLASHVALFRQQAAAMGLSEHFPSGHWMIMDGVEIRGRDRGHGIKTPHNSDGVTVEEWRVGSVGQFNVFNGAVLCFLPDGRCAARPVQPEEEAGVVTMLEQLGYQRKKDINLPALNRDRFVDPSKGEEWEKLRDANSSSHPEELS